MKNSSGTIRNRTCDRPACGAVPQPTAPPRDPRLSMRLRNTEHDTNLHRRKNSTITSYFV
jgi:hypothetical protein